jgi:hypothetical protein
MRKEVRAREGKEDKKKEKEKREELERPYSKT